MTRRLLDQVFLPGLRSCLWPASGNQLIPWLLLDEPWHLSRCRAEVSVAGRSLCPSAAASGSAVEGQGHGHWQLCSHCDGSRRTRCLPCGSCPRTAWKGTSAPTYISQKPLGSVTKSRPPSLPSRIYKKIADIDSWALSLGGLVVRDSRSIRLWKAVT